MGFGSFWVAFWMVFGRFLDGFVFCFVVLVLFFLCLGVFSTVFSCMVVNGVCCGGVFFCFFQLFFDV